MVGLYSQGLSYFSSIKYTNNDDPGRRGRWDFFITLQTQSFGGQIDGPVHSTWKELGGFCEDGKKAFGLRI